MKFFGEELVIKMWDSFIDKGVGGILKPAQEKRLGKTRHEIRRDELLSLAQAEEDAKKIATGEAIYCGNGQIKLLRSEQEIDTLNSDRIEPYIGELSIYAQASAIQTAEAMQKEINIAKSMIKAEDELAQSEAPASDKEVERDWLFAWRGYAERVSSEELQSLWGKVLAGEIRSPGSYSIRTMEFLKCLTKAEAQLIEKIAKYVMGNVICRELTEYYENQNVNFHNFLFLQQIGLLSGVESVGLDYKINNRAEDSFIGYFFTDRKLIIIKDPSPQKDIAIKAYALTALGKEVFTLAGATEDEECFYKIAQLFAERAAEVVIADHKPAENGQVTYFNEIEVHKPSKS